MLRINPAWLNSFDPLPSHILMGDPLIKFDLLTSRYKLIMDALAAKERKAFAGLLEIGSGTAKEIRTVSRLTSDEVSVYMSRLIKKGLVKKEGTFVQFTYLVVDSDFSEWYKLRRSQRSKKT
jgi:hypothetical protein